MSDYVSALAGIEKDWAQPTAPLNPLAKTIFLTHGKKVARVIVFLHGYTNCPHQFRRLGELYYARGYNVLIPRMLGHGMADRMTVALEGISAENLQTQTHTTHQIAAGLGDHITVMGLSAGGVLAAWMTYQTPQIDCAVLVAPVFGLNAVPAPLTRLATRVFRTAPNRYIWWDAPHKADDGPQSHTYPRFSTRALGDILAVGQMARTQQRPPSAKKVIVVLNENDEAVNNRLTKQVVKRWRKQGAPIETYVFPQYHSLNHDLIDPAHPEQKIDLVYPILWQLTKMKDEG